MSSLVLTQAVISGADAAAFETDHKADAVEVVLDIATFALRSVSYAQFVTLVDGDWARVHYRDDGDAGYVLFYTTGAFDAVLGRPSENPLRTYVDFQLDAVTADTLAYTVPGGKTLYVTSWGGTMQNTMTSSLGHVRIRDGVDVTGQVRASWTVPTAIVGTQAPHQRLFATFPEPKRFTAGLFVDMVSGALTVCFQGTGYLE